ncbi:unnamed protein product [Somion occarium]|uniref:Proline dehydrogenase n=1 Tax=Somion occarium TaxID=3059160 RepID=A0ABP1CMK8_9APHY
MVTHLLRGSLLRQASSLSSRHFSVHSTFKRSAWRNTSKGFRWSLASGAVLATSAVFLQSAIHADALDPPKNDDHKKPTPLSSLIRSYIVYTACCIPGLVDWSPAILSTLMSVPLLKQITEAIVRVTFFNQFVGGDTAHGTVPVLESLQEQNKGSILVYSVEVDETEAAGGAKKNEVPAHKLIVDEMIQSINVAADFEEQHPSSSGVRSTWVAVKLTALLPNAQSLINFSKHLVNTRPRSSPPVLFPGAPHPTDLDALTLRSAQGTSLTEQDIIDLKDLHADLVRICTRAQERGIRLLIDAEHSWYQPAIDSFTLALMRQFNKVPDGHSESCSKFQPLIYTTIQAYLRRTPAYVAQSLADAEAGGYALGIKLVRGAYHPYETTAHFARTSGDEDLKHNSLSISPDPEPPVWATKPDSDAAFNNSVKVILEAVAQDIEGNKSSSRRGSLSSLLKKDADSAPAPPTIGVIFGSHNWDSQKLVLKELIKLGLANVEGTTENGEPIIRIGDEVIRRVSVAQLYGMTDALTNYIVDRTSSSSPFVLKYVPYGALAEVMPYLSRRAIENKSVLGTGAATEERKRAAAEIKKRIFG